MALRSKNGYVPGPHQGYALTWDALLFLLGGGGGRPLPPTHRREVDLGAGKEVWRGARGGVAGGARRGADGGACGG